ncbi:MAG: M28 family peptidase [Bacteroidales bacterium]|nr:M28 family peptidase [Bacteroidales bacterium]
MRQNTLRRHLRALTATALAALCATATAQTERAPLAMPTANTDSVMKHIIELSSETYRGRMAGTEGYDAAADYVSRTLQRYGATVDLQRFQVESNEVENCKFVTYTPGTKERHTYILGDDYCCAGMTGRGYIDAQMVFVGYGIDNPEYDEYANVDVRGKIALVLTGLPEHPWLPAAATAHSMTLRDKARIAERHGAIGMLAINTSPSCLPTEPQGRAWCGELPHLATFPILQLTLECGRNLMQYERTTLDEALRDINTEHTPRSYTLSCRAEVDVNALYRGRAVTANVLGMLKGTDRRLNDEIIVVGASMDGVGMQGETCLFPGADINGSGVAAVLETARLLSLPQYRPRRSVLFVLFSGGEQQFLGSRIFLRNYPRLRKIEAFVNAQNIGCGDSIVVLGDNRYPSLYDIVRTRDREHFGLIVNSEDKTNPRGDARGFDQIGIPSVVLTTLNGMQHNRVTTDIWENIDRRILMATTQVMAETVRELADGIYQGRSIKSKTQKFIE